MKNFVLTYSRLYYSETWNLPITLFIKMKYFVPTYSRLYYSETWKSPMTLFPVTVNGKEKETLSHTVRKEPFQNFLFPSLSSFNLGH